MRAVVLLLCAVTSVYVTQTSPVARLPFVDTARQDHDLEAVRDRALSAAKARDVSALMALVSESLVVDGEDESIP